MNKVERIKELVQTLNKANKDYYELAKPTLSDREYDQLYNELVSLEKETGIILSGSPTQYAGYNIESKWDKITHEFPALSLNKTKDRNELLNWLGDKEGILSWKCDGLTVIMSYDNGKLTTLASRGNGIVGEDFTKNARYIHGIPLEIPHKGHLVVRGETLISYKTFEDINNLIENEEDKFKTCRNLASGTIRNLDSKIVADRNVEVKAFELVYADNMPRTYFVAFDWLSNLGFDVVEHKEVTKDNLLETIKWFENKIKDNEYPSDGLVLVYNDIDYGRSLGTTSKFPLNGIAFKWADDTYETTVWSSSRNSLNPVLLFETVNIDGADISRASIHNINIMKDLELGIGDTVEVYLANKIIPQIADNQTRSNTFTIPDTCPVCGASTEIMTSDDGITQVLKCTNENCPGKLLGKLKLFCSKEGMNVDGLSEATLQTFINKGWLKDISDIYSLHNHETEMQHMKGFGKKSVTKLLDAIDKSRTVTMENFIRSLGVPLIGRTQSKALHDFCNGDINKFDEYVSSRVDFSTKIEGFGEKRNQSIHNWFRNNDNVLIYNKMRKEVTFVRTEGTNKTENSASKNLLNNQTFCITGKLNHFVNRDALVEKIQSYGGKYVSSVSSKLDWLINNDTTSTSGKNKKMHELGKEDHIISEEDFLKMIEE